MFCKHGDFSHSSFVHMQLGFVDIERVNGKCLLSLPLHALLKLPSGMFQDSIKPGRILFRLFNLLQMRNLNLA